MTAGKRINPNLLKTRDLLKVALINGGTKSGVQPDRRKEANRSACREEPVSAPQKNATQKPNHRTALNENLQTLTELKYLKTQLAAEKARVETLRAELKLANQAVLEEATKAHRAQAALQIVGLPDLSDPDFDKAVEKVAGLASPKAPGPSGLE